MTNKIRKARPELDPATGNIKGNPILCITGKPRLPRAPVDRTLELEFVQQIETQYGPFAFDLCYEAGVYAFEREYFFAKPRLWRFDVALPSLKIAVEIEGGTKLWRTYKCRKCGAKFQLQTGGRHNDTAGFDEDCRKYGVAESMGWHVLRVTSEMITDKSGIDLLVKLIGLKMKTENE